ncbi:hypothetical protein SeLEV6574_g02661 [Synchytrium endobioticum]|uniref:Uncharacterized protein n=1 Tax=Synchytrium endobioticum TaxID=286115 RepID=A0A507D848_9FUNG|nr:hypothetical protein SeLEV6574_g02661 [Synchytrium endobioticum]
MYKKHIPIPSIHRIAGTPVSASCYPSMLWLRTVVVILLMPIQIHLALAVTDETYNLYAYKLDAKYENLIREFESMKEGNSLALENPEAEAHYDDNRVRLSFIEQCMSSDFPFGLAESTQAPDEFMTVAELIFKWHAHRLLYLLAQFNSLTKVRISDLHDEYLAADSPILHRDENRTKVFYGISRRLAAALPSLKRAHSSLEKAYRAILPLRIVEKTIRLEPGFRTSNEGTTQLLDDLDQENCASVSKALASEITRMIKAVKDIKEDEEFSSPIENLVQARVMTSKQYIELIVKTSIPMPLPYVDRLRDLSKYFWKNPPTWMKVEFLVIIRQIHALAYQKLKYSILLLTDYLTSNGLSTESLNLSRLESARKMHLKDRITYQEALGQAWRDVNRNELQMYHGLVESALKNLQDYGMRSKEDAEQFLALHNVLSPVYPYMLAQVKGLPFWVTVALKTKTDKDTPPELLQFGLQYYDFVFRRAYHISQLFTHVPTLHQFLEEAHTKLNHYRQFISVAHVDAHLVPQLDELRIGSSNTDDRHASRTRTTTRSHRIDRPSSSSGQSSSGGYIGN